MSHPRSRSDLASSSSSSSSDPLPSVAPKLCSYSDSSEEETEPLQPQPQLTPPPHHPQSGCASPRKRRRQNKVSHLDALNLHPTKDQVLDLDQLFSPDYDLTGGLIDGFERILPGFRDLEISSVQDLLLLGPNFQASSEPIDPTAAPASREVEFEFDAETFELKPVVKKPKSEDWPSSSGPNASTTPSATNSPVAGPSESTQPAPLNAADPISQPDPAFKKPKLRNRKFIFKPFLRQPDGRLVHNEASAPLDVVIPEQLAASYGLYIWPCSPVLSWYLWLHQEEIRGKRVLELGAGTSLPGLLCAKIGAERVWLSDDATAPNILNNCEEAVRLNGLEDKVKVIGIRWGSFDPDLFSFESHLDYIIGSDLFFDPEVFDPLCVTLSFLLKRNPGAQVLISVQERSEYWTVEENFLKWNLKGKIISPQEFLAGTGIEESDLTDRHTIYILNITYDGDQ